MSRFLPSVAPEIRAGHAADLKAIGAVMPYLWPRDDPGMRMRVVLSVVVLFLTAILNALLPVLFALAIDRLTPKDASLIVVAPVALLLAYGFIFWFSRSLNELRWILFGPLEQRVRRRLGLAVFDHLHTLSLRYHLSRRTGMLSRIQERGLEATAELLFNLVFVIAPLVTEIVIITAVVLGRFDAHYALIMAATLSLFLSAVIFGSEMLRRYQRPAVIKAAEAHGKAIDSLLNYETVKYFGNENYVSRRYDSELSEAERLTVRSLIFRSLLGVAQMTVLGIGAGAIVVLGGMDVASGAMTVGAFVLINTYLLQLVRPLERLGNLYRSIKQALIDLEQMVRIFDEKPEVTDAENAVPLPDGPGAIRFENVSFAYDPRRPILKNVSFDLEPGHKLALVGPSGGGKTTLGRLLFRFYDPVEGRVEIDGHDIRNHTQDSVRAAVGVVPQDTVLFNEAIGENIQFGRPDASREEVENAAKLAQIEGFIESLPDGFNTVVGERGLKLSGGEKQRVAIARAVLKHPRIFLFDEATSALDSHTEQAIQNSLTEVSRGSTTVVIAHRLSTVVDADQILFIEAGEIVERGSHLQLLAKKGHYADLWEKQQRASDDSNTLGDDTDVSIPAQ
ncbi:MAG: ABC transporter ATP-binding protein/permease [Alphaproteobacteria bacterium]|jgi:ABC-type transport system involved in Fe-S cluster assembly fused permease/ATPase subunit|nr:ABC transporter ATP-binding protein/permease [Alphaproteobacteria bacterium]